MKKNNIDTPLDFSKAKEKALNYLEYRIHSEKELSQKLKRAGALDEDIEKIIEFLKEYKLLDDEDFATRFARDLKVLKKYGKNRIKQELYLKGINKDIIDNVLSDLEDTDMDTLYDMIKKHLKGNFDKKNTDRVIRYFITRGYSIDEIKTCIRKSEEEYNEKGNYDEL